MILPCGSRVRILHPRSVLPREVWDAQEGSLNRRRVSMARYGRDFDRDRWGMQGDEGAGGGTGFYGGGDRLGNHWRGGQGGGYGADYGGMGSDAQGYPGWS